VSRRLHSRGAYASLANCTPCIGVCDLTFNVAGVLLQAALNGPFGKDTHPAMPVATEELVRDAAACVRAGAGAVHMHPRDVDGRESLEPPLIDAVVESVRAACGVPVGVSTGAWIEPDLDRRVAMIARWHQPDYASVNVSEGGSVRVMQALLQAGVGIEAGVWSVEDARRFAGSGLADRVTRVLVEPVDAGAAALATVEAIHAELDAGGVKAPRLQHGDGDATWILIEDAFRRGCDTRVGLEDTWRDPDGSVTAGNETLVRAADRYRLNAR
jgi:uncharacterized protein (DUF849 family)